MENIVPPDEKTITTVAQVDVKTAWASKINWTQAVGIAATILAVVSGNKYQVPVETQLSLVAGIQGIQAVVTFVMKTWFTKTITPASAAAPDVPTKDVLK
jgi:hypothetical protein